MSKTTGENSSASSESIGYSASSGQVSTSAPAANVSMSQIFADVSRINPQTSSISSLGGYVSQSQQMIADAAFKEIITALPKESLARKIMIDNKGTFSEKQRWVIAYELAKNPEYKAGLVQRNAEAKAFEERQRAARHARNERRQERANAYASTQGLRTIARGERVSTGATVYDKYGTSYSVTQRKGDIFYIKDANGKVTGAHKSKLYIK